MIDSDLITELLTTYANLFQCETIVKFYNYEKIMESIYRNYKFICSKSLNSTICIMGLIKSVIKSNNFEFKDIYEDVKRFKNDGNGIFLKKNFEKKDTKTNFEKNETIEDSLKKTKNNPPMKILKKRLLEFKVTT